MHKVVIRSPLSYSKKIQSMERGTVVITKTICRWILASNLASRKSRLTQAMKQKRLDIAKRHAS